MRLEAPAGDHPRDILAALKSALHGAGPALALGAPAGRLPARGSGGHGGGRHHIRLDGGAQERRAQPERPDRVGDVDGGAHRRAEPGSSPCRRPTSRACRCSSAPLVAGREPAVLGGRFTPQAFAAAALSMASARGGERVPSYTSLVPAQLQTILDAAADDDTVLRAARSFEAVLIGGQALPAAVRERAEAAGVRIVRTYGSTETSGGCVYDGVPLDGTRMRVVEGELQLSGPTLADGYLGDPDRTAAAFPLDADGTRWYRTGDEAVIDDGVAAGAGADRQRHRLRRHQRLPRPRRTGRAGHRGSARRRGDRRRRRAVGRSIRHRVGRAGRARAGRGASAHRARRRRRRDRPARAALATRARARPCRCCRPASPTGSASAATSPDAALERQVRRSRPPGSNQSGASTTQKRLPSVSSITTKSASGG